MFPKFLCILFCPNGVYSYFLLLLTVLVPSLSWLRFLPLRSLDKIPPRGLDRCLRDGKRGKHPTPARSTSPLHFGRYHGSSLSSDRVSRSTVS